MDRRKGGESRRHSQGERIQYLNDHYDSWRSWHLSTWIEPGLAMSWESWSLNGEACVENRIPLSSGSDLVALYLRWTLRELASHCRRVSDASGMIPFEFQGPRTPSAFARALDHWFDLALLDPKLVRERIRRLGADADGCRWPGYWVEREGVVLLVQERQVTIPAAPRRIATSVRRKWESCVDIVAGAAGNSGLQAATRDKHLFLAGVLVAVHRQPTGGDHGRPGLEDSLRRHEQFVGLLDQVDEGKPKPVTWHALWRLPPGMKVADPPGADPWMRYPAVSLVASVFAGGAASGPTAPTGGS